MMVRFVNTKILVCFFMLALPNQSNAEKLTLDKLSSFTSTSKSGQFRVMVEFNNQTVSAKLNGFASVNRRSINKANKESDRDAYLLRTLKRQSNIAGHMGGRYIRPNLRTLSVNQSELANLIADGSLTVYEDQFHKPSLASSVNVIFPDQATSAYSGSGQTVVILDTGVNKNHSFLSGSVIAAAEACFSTTDTNQSLVSLCPNNEESMIGSGAAAACDSNIAECAHGTQMAGVIAGESVNFNGVATATTIIPIQIYTSSSSELVCGDASLTPCIGALTSDIVSALDYIDSIKSSHSIAAVNISAGTTATFQGQCDVNEPMAYIDAIDSLVSSGIAVIASSGNDALSNEMSSPACLSDVIAVAATDDSDVAWSSNNRNSELDFFAPGVSVTTSTLPNNSFSEVSGTSVAAAHVSGAWAVIKSRSPNASVTSVKNTFINNGTLVTQGLFTRPRINLTDALGDNIISPEPESSFYIIPLENGKSVVIFL